MDVPEADPGKANGEALARRLDIARGLLEQPTAPMKEVLPQEYIRNFVRQRPELRLAEDSAGNLIVRYTSQGAAAQPPLVLVAHLDHPAFWIDRISSDAVEMTFKGFVSIPHARVGTRVRFFEVGRREPTGTGELMEVGETEKHLSRGLARIQSGHAVEGGFAMWDFPGFSLSESFIITRCCDDLLGAAAALCTLDEIARLKPPDVNLWALFTRAEEIGFLGALEAVRLKTLPRNSCVLSLECSKAAGIAPQGEGVAVRVGDRSSIFDPNLSEALRLSAEAVRKADPQFKYQRKLMDGGTCEATVFCAYGYRSSGLALPLGNYHNQAMGKDGPEIGPENVMVSDFVSEIRLLTELAQKPQLLEKSVVKAPEWLQQRARMAQVELGTRKKSRKRSAQRGESL